MLTADLFYVSPTAGVSGTIYIIKYECEGEEESGVEGWAARAVTTRG